MHLNLIGLSHHTAPIDIRDQVALTESVQDRALSLLKASGSKLLEGVVLSTCNRSEVYATTEGDAPDALPVEHLFHEIHGLSRGVLTPYLYRKSDEAAIRHLFRVVSSLDSMVMGEQQILGQVKNAYLKSLDEQTTGVVLNRLFERALVVGKKVREQTEIGVGAVSVSSVAVELAKKIFKDLSQHTAMLIGAGETGELTARYLADHGIRSIVVANRTVERAVEVANRFNGAGVHIDEGLQMMKDTDIVISSTGADHHILRREDLAEIMRARRNKPIFLIDIAVPRDIDPHVRSVYNVFLYDIDDLQTVADENTDRRKKEAQEAEQIVEGEVMRFLGWYQGLAVTPTIKELRRQADEIRSEELQKTLARLEHLSDGDRQTVEQMSRLIINKLLHTPTVRLKDVSQPGEDIQHLSSIRHLFGLDENKNEGD
ncbi:MAG: glutamyl-tRNA reductase [Candidatus Latescibacteria bacterium]|nr:glutamyl-tRNA reductase [Candidatus Latescibacterota bacterium]